MGDLELFPGDYSRSTDFVWFNTESAVLVIKHMTLLSEDTRQKPDDGPTQKSSVGCGITTIEERIFLL